MDENEKLEHFFTRDHRFKAEINRLRDLILSTELEEHYKWSTPVYCLNTKNVLSIAAFKAHFGIWFFNGVFLKDPARVLENAQEGKTKAMRHWKFQSLEEIDENLLKVYILEAIENEKKGMRLQQSPGSGKPKKNEIPEHLKAALEQDAELSHCYRALTPYKQREYSEYITVAKREETQINRLEKILPMIKQGIGLNDKYRNC